MARAPHREDGRLRRRWGPLGADQEEPDALDRSDEVIDDPAHVLGCVDDGRRRGVIDDRGSGRRRGGGGGR
jgi:hypothetical protein